MKFFEDIAMKGRALRVVFSVRAARQRRPTGRANLPVRLFLTLLFGVITSAWAATQPLPGEYTGEWRGRIDPELPAAARTVRVVVSTNGEVMLFKTTINPITGDLRTTIHYGAVQRNGIIRSAENYGKFRAVPREKGHSIRGVWIYPTRFGPIVRRFYATLN